MLIAETLSDKLPPWNVTTGIVLASVFAFMGLACAKRFVGSETWLKSRNKTFGTFIEYLGAFVTAMLMTFVIGDWIAISSEALKQVDYAYAQKVGNICAIALFFTVFFGTLCLNRLTRLRLILTLIPGAVLTTCLVIIHNAK